MQMPQEMQGLKVSPDMMNFGISAGQEIINKQRDRLMPGVSTFWLSLKFYFSVSHTYITKKIQVVVYPYSNKEWKRIPADEYDRGDEAENYSAKWALPKQDHNCPDLYIPLMSFATYVLLSGLKSGMTGGKVFTPEILVQTIWRCLILSSVEALIFKLGVNVMSVAIPFLDLLAYQGYIYVGLCISLISRLLGTFVSFVVAVYIAVMLAIFTLKTFVAIVPSNSDAPGPPRHVVLLGFAVMQGIVSLILSQL